MDEEKLICLVQKYKELYDFSDSNYHNQQCKDNIWEEIAGEMNRPGSECKKRWSTLRDSYRKSIKGQQTRSGESAAKKKSWRYDKQMTFLRPFLADRQQITNVIESESSETETQHQGTDESSSFVDADDVISPESIPSSSTSRPEPRSEPTIRKAAPNKLKVSTQNKSYSQQKKNALSTAAVLQNYLTDRNNQRTKHPETSSSITKFFDCMAETVKTFSPQLQIEVKSKIFGIVTDAESRNLNFSPMTPATRQEADFPNQSHRFTHIQQQNRTTMPQPPFQHQLYQSPYPQPQTQHPSAIPLTLYSQPQAHHSSASYPPYSQQNNSIFTPIQSPSNDLSEDIGEYNNENNDNASN